MDGASAQPSGDYAGATQHAQRPRSDEVSELRVRMPTPAAGGADGGQRHPSHETSADDHAAAIFEALKLAQVEDMDERMPGRQTLQQARASAVAVSGDDSPGVRSADDAEPESVPADSLVLTPRGGDFYAEIGAEQPSATSASTIEVEPIAVASDSGGSKLPPPGSALAMQLLKRTAAGSRARSTSRTRRKPRVHRPVRIASGERRRFGIIFCEDEANWVEELPALWIRLLRQPGEEWIVYRAAEKCEIPSLSDNLDGVVIPGSRYSAYEQHDWILRLKEYLRACFIPWLADHTAPEHAMKPQIVGSCFGCQLVAEALGGHVTRNPRGQYIVKAEEIYPTEAFCRQPFADGLVLKTRRGARVQTQRERWTMHDDLDSEPFMRVTQTHGDTVITLPVDSQVLGWSKTVTNEVFLTGKNMLSYQCHPEFTVRRHIMEKIIPYVFPESMDSDEFEQAKKSFDAPLHSHALIEITRRFLKREYRDTYAMYHTGLPPRQHAPSPVPSAEGAV